MEKELEKLIKKNQAKWLNLLNKFTPNYCDAEDVLQDTLIRALRYLPKYDPTRAGMNYMLGIEANKDKELPKEIRNVRDIVLLEDREFGEAGSIPVYWDDTTGRFTEIK